METDYKKKYEEAVEEVFKVYPYPRYCGNGLWELAPGVFGGNKALELMEKKLKEKLK